MSQILPSGAPQPNPAPPPPPPPPASSTSSQSAETKQKIAAIYAEAATQHTSAAQVQEQINAVLAESQPATPTTSTSLDDGQVNLFDASA
jgi:hypothetical protein